MKSDYPTVTILIAEDDDDDRLIIKRALTDNGINGDLRFVENGRRLLDYLHRRNGFEKEQDAPSPDIILLDLNMPQMNGFEALREIRSNNDFRFIPIVVLSTSRDEKDIFKAYDLGANSYITKRTIFPCVKVLAETLGKYWFGVVSLPKHRKAAFS